MERCAPLDALQLASPFMLQGVTALRVEILLRACCFDHIS
jgi:hypothetical protein